MFWFSLTLRKNIGGFNKNKAFYYYRLTKLLVSLKILRTHDIFTLFLITLIIFLCIIVSVFSSHFITQDISLEETARTAEYFLADGLILTGNTTGDPTKVTDVEAVKKTVVVPVIVGSGVNCDNVQEYLNADALIIGSYFKRNGKWFNELEEDRIKKLITKLCLI